ncbi:restriction endonuclease [Massilia sp. YMA4]|uniref:restriction endonuclease n=1 Tax=Massilia sp. YMA4 TaxID=1593482 RepID=UPI000DD1567E|nr:restriction endonuclease [Massilia sp. YMA4]AXA90826.1 restriction endonuclease [Massilia sp. YMA4]
MQIRDDDITLTPQQYELAVKGILDGAALGLEQYSSKHLEAIQAPDGSYIFDVTARFSALGADFLVLIECKHERRKVERQDVQVLHAKLVSTGAQKAMLFSIAGFQSGALDYAAAHGIALVQLASGKSTWFTKSTGLTAAAPRWLNVPEYVGWWCNGNCRSVMTATDGEFTRDALLAPKPSCRVTPWE